MTSEMRGRNSKNFSLRVGYLLDGVYHAVYDSAIGVGDFLKFALVDFMLKGCPCVKLVLVVDEQATGEDLAVLGAVAVSS